MRFMLMMNAPAGDGDYKINDWSPEDFSAHIAFMHHFNDQLGGAGELVACEGLAPPKDAAEGTLSVPERDYLNTKGARHPAT